MKHTEGKWLIKNRYLDHNGYYVYVVKHATNPNDDELDANCKLIQGAGDLLEACMELIDPLTGLLDDSTASIIGKERAYKIEQAISKATI
jgi:hypothetical protein